MLIMSQFRGRYSCKKIFLTIITLNTLFPMLTDIFLPDIVFVKTSNNLFFRKHLEKFFISINFK